MASFKYDVRIDNNEFIEAVTKEIKEQISIRLSQFIAMVRPDVVRFVEDALRKDPDGIYTSLNNGDLQIDFGFESGQNVGEKVVKEVSNSISFTKLRPNSFSVGGLRLEVLKGGINFLLNKDFSSYDSNGNSVDWLNWLLLAGDTIVVADYEVIYKRTRSSRSGRGLMISPEMTNGFRVRPEMSGVEDDNWITRSLLVAEKKLQEHFQKAFRYIV
jgi:hypothetical protein